MADDDNVAEQTRGDTHAQSPAGGLSGGFFVRFVNLLVAETYPSHIKRAADINSFHRGRINKLTAWSIILGSVAIFLLFQLDSPDYSVLKVLSNLHSAEAVGDAGWVGSVLPISKKLTVKFVFLCFIAVILLLQLRIANPFYNPEQLLKINHDPDSYPKSKFGKLFFEGVCRDVRAYAMHLPSSRLPRLCSQCEYGRNCGSYVGSQDDFRSQYSFPVWKYMYDSGSFDVGALNRLTAESFLCRLVYSIKLVCVNVIAIGVVSFFAHRIVEFFFVREHLSFPPGPLLVILAAAIIYAVFDGFNNSRDVRNLFGVWSRFQGASREISNELRHGAKNLVSAYEEKVCSAGGGAQKFKPFSPDMGSAPSFEEGQVKLLGMTLQHIDILLCEKLILLAGRDKAISEIRHSETVVKILHAFLENAFKPANSIGVQIIKHLCVDSFANDTDDGALLQLFVDGLKPRNNRLKYYSISRQTSDLGDRLHDGIGSVLVAKIDFTEVGQRYLTRIAGRGNGVPLDEVSFGWLCVKASSPDTFTEGPDLVVLRAILPFMHRLAFELARDYLTARRKKNEAGQSKKRQ